MEPEKRTPSPDKDDEESDQTPMETADSAESTGGSQSSNANTERRTRRRRPKRVRRTADKENADLRKAKAIDAAIRQINLLQSAIAVEGDDDDDSEDDGSEFEDCVDSEFIGALHNVDAKALGFIACAHETMKYLTESGGIPRDDPMMVNLRNRLIQGLNNM